MISIEFTKDFATRKKGDVIEVDSMLGSYLIGTDKVAKLYKEKKKSSK